MVVLNPCLALIASYKPFRYLEAVDQGQDLEEGQRPVLEPGRGLLREVPPQRTGRGEDGAAAPVHLKQGGIASC